MHNTTNLSLWHELPHLSPDFTFEFSISSLLDFPRLQEGGNLI